MSEFSIDSLVVERSLPSRAGIYLQYAAAMLLWCGIMVAMGVLILRTAP